MGFRCPECKEDYGFDELAFRKHALEKHCVDTTDTLECFFWAERLSFRCDREQNKSPRIKCPPDTLRLSKGGEDTPFAKGDFQEGGPDQESNAHGPGE